jgi:uncharacterized protein (TIGR01244 family)
MQISAVPSASIIELRILKTMGLVCLLSCYTPTLIAEVNAEKNYRINKITDSTYVSGQPSVNDFALLKQLKIQNIISFRPPSEHPQINEAEIASQYQMAFYTIPIDTPEQITYERVATLEQILTSLNQEPTLMHCASGNRVGAMMTAHAYWFRGQNLEDALKTGERYGLTRWRGDIEKLLLQYRSQ